MPCCLFGFPQAQGAGGRPIKYRGMMDVFRHTVRKEGVLGLYKVSRGPVRGVMRVCAQQWRMQHGRFRHGFC